MINISPKRWSMKPPLGQRINGLAPLSKGLIGYWRLGEGAGLTAFDSSYYGNKGTLNGGATWSAGRFGKALNLDGTNGYVDISTVLNKFDTAVGTIAFWLRQDSPTGLRETISFRVDGNNEIEILQFNGNFGLNFRFAYTAGGVFKTVNTTAVSNDDKWHHIVMTWTKSKDAMICYVDGVQVGINNGLGTFAGTLTVGYLGRDATGDYWLGRFDDVRIYNRAISTAEVKQLYYNPFQIFVPQSPDLRYWLTLQTRIQFDAASNSGYQAASSSYSFARTCTGVNRFLTVDISLLSAGQTVTSVVDDFDGTPVNFTFIGARSTVSSVGRIESWGLVAPVTGTKNIQVNLSGAIASASCAVSYTGVHQTLPTEAFNSNQATNVGAADATVDVTSIADQCWVHAAIATDDGNVTAGQVNRNEVNGAGGSGADEDFGPQSPTTKTMSYTDVGALATWAIAGYAIRPIAASGPASLVYTNANLRSFLLTGIGI